MILSLGSWKEEKIIMDKNLPDNYMWVRCGLLSRFRNAMGIIWILGEENLCLWRTARIGEKLSSPPLTEPLLKL